MSDGLAEKPTKKIKIQSLASFWWHVVKKSFKNSWEPFETFGGICALFAGIVTMAFLAHRITQDWTDYMIYWSIAVPVAVWWVWFLWNLVKIPHKIYKDDLNAVISGAAPIYDKKTNIQNFARVLFVVAIVSAFLGIVALKNHQIAQIKALLPSPEKNVVAKPLPTKIIPRPEPPPPPAPIVSTQQLEAVENQKQIENFDAVTGGVGDFATYAAKVKAEQAAKADDQTRQQLLGIQKLWDVYLPYYQRSLVVLNIVLNAEAEKTGDGISQSADYDKSLPPTIDPKTGAFQIATIGFQKNTNMNFIVSVAGLNQYGTRYLIISCSGGFVEMNASYGNLFYRHLHFSPDFDDGKSVPIADADKLIVEAIKGLVSAQKDFLSNTNKQNQSMP